MSTEKSLRDLILEAMAQPIAEEMYDVPQYHQEREHVAASNALDAILDVLAATDDIPLYPSETGYRDVVYTTPAGVTAEYLIDVLRADE